MENRFVPARFKDGYGPVGAWFLLFKAQVMNGAGEDYNKVSGHLIKDTKRFGKYGQGVPGTCLRNHIMINEMKEGRGPIMMDTPAAMAKLAEKMTPKEVKHLEAEAWEDFLDMTISQCGIWAGENIEPDKQPSEIMPTEPYLLGSHAGCAGIWVSGPNDIPGTPKEWSWGYNRMTTVKGLFTSGDGVGASGHKFSSGSHAEGRIAAKAMVKFALDNKGWKNSPKRFTGRSRPSSSTRTTPRRSTSILTTSRPRCCSSGCRRSWMNTARASPPGTRPTPRCSSCAKRSSR
jgi:adenylylsulfate reductase subunit A